MSSVDYKQKYLKYKNKYMELKAQANAQQKQNQLQSQTGGFAYSPGEYVFFIPKNRSDFQYSNVQFDNGVILGMNGLDKLTTWFGNCTKFLRVGKASWLGDINNSYNTIYTNQGIGSVIGRESKDAYNATKPYINSAINTTQQVANQALEYGKKGTQQLGQTIGNTYQQYSSRNQNTPYNQNASDNQNALYNENTPYSQNIQDNQNTLPNQNFGSPTMQFPEQDMNGGEGECIRRPYKLDNKFLIGNSNDVKVTKLQDLVNIINEKLQGSLPDNQIGRIIYVKKPTIPGKQTIIDLEKHFIVQNGKVIQTPFQVSMGNDSLSMQSQQGFPPMQDQSQQGYTPMQSQQGFPQMQDQSQQGFPMQDQPQQGYTPMQSQQGFPSMQNQSQQGFPSMQNQSQQGYTPMQNQSQQGFSNM
jgi:hypothetical protein